MKISDNLCYGKFLSRTAAAMLGYPVGKKIEFSRLNVTFYSILEKNISV